MRYAIRNKETSEIAHIYEAPAPRYYGGKWSDPAIFEHMEYPMTAKDIRARLLGKFERDGFRRVAAVHPPHHLSRLGLLPPGNSEAQAASALIGAVKQAVNDAEDAIELITDAEQLEAFEPTWPE